MNADTKRLAIIATFCFFPTALVGWFLYDKSENRALNYFRFSIGVMMALVLITGITVVLKGGQIIKPMGSFF